MLGLVSRNCPSPVRNNSILRMLILLLIPSLLFIPILYYSLTTPFGLVDDYRILNHVQRFDDLVSRLSEGTFLDFRVTRGRYRPFWRPYNAITAHLFGATPWAYHLGRWIWHFGAVFVFVAAFRCFSRNPRRETSPRLVERDKFDHLLPLAFLIYVWVFFPNSPSSRLGTQEVYSVFFLGLCTYMTAFILSKKTEDKRTSSAFPQYVLFHMGYAGLCWSKEINVAAALWILTFYCVFLVSGNVRKKLMASIPLALIFSHTCGMVYLASETSGVGYKEFGIAPSPVDGNAIKILKGLFQVETSLVITVGFAALFTILLLFVIFKRRSSKLKNESLFVLFLLGLFMSLFSILSLSYDVALRYWYVLIPVFAMLLAFSVRFTLKSVRRHHPIFTYGTGAILAGFVVFFVAVNYSNFLFQTVVQHALRGVDQRLVSEIFRLVDQEKYVQIDSPRVEMERQLLRAVPRFSNYFLHRNFRTHRDKPEAGREYFLVARKRKLPADPDDRLTIIPQSSYPLLRYASTIATALQRRSAFSDIDAGVHRPDHYTWNIYRLTSGEIEFSALSEVPEPLIRSEFDVYFNHNRNMLIYVKEPCREEDSRPLFFFHVIPVDMDILPKPRKERGFENLDFFFDDYGLLDGGKCVAARELPDYPIAKIRTGQHVDGAPLWQGELRFDEQSGSDLFPFTTP